MDTDTIMILIFAWFMTLIGAAGLGTWHGSKSRMPEYKRGHNFAVQYYQEFEEFPTNDVVEKAFHYGRIKYVEELSIIRKRANLEFVLPNSFKEKGVNESK